MCIASIMSAKATDSKPDLYDQYQKQSNYHDSEISILNQIGFNKSYAIVIGIGDYIDSSWPKLESPVHDAIRVRDYLINSAEFDYVVTLTNGSATKDRIEELMVEKFPAMLTTRDRFLFYFSGHGTQRTIKGSTFGYLVMRGSSNKSYGNMISMQDIEKWDSLIHPTKHVLFILDTCFSGLAGFQTKSPFKKKTIERLSQYSHYLITAGSADEESVASLQKWGGSLFTDSFLRAVYGNADLRSGDYKSDGVVSLMELMAYIGDRIDYESVMLNNNRILKKKIVMSPQVSQLQNSIGEFFFEVKKTSNSIKIQGKNVLPDKEFKGKRKINENPNKITENPQFDGMITQKIKLRTQAIEISENNVRDMVLNVGFYERRWNKKRLFHSHLTDELNGTLYEHNSGLLWQKGGSVNHLTRSEANKYINQLNGNKFAGKSTWRIPAIEELSSLLMDRDTTNSIYLSTIFDKDQYRCWSIDYPMKNHSWIVNFSSGIIYYDRDDKKCFVKAVCSE